MRVIHLLLYEFILIYILFFSLKTEAEIVACIQIQNSALLFQVSLFTCSRGGSVGIGDVWEIPEYFEDNPTLESKKGAQINKKLVQSF